MIYDINTKNMSFLLISQILRKNGVKNNKFMLALYDKSLVGVNPRSKEVEESTELQLKIYRECCRNIWYFLREVVMIPANGAEIPYEMNLGNLTLTYLKILNINFILLLPRQHGKTVSEVVFDVWELCFATKNANIIYLNKDRTNAVENLKRFRDIKNLLPTWLLDNYIADPKKDVDNQESKVIAKLNNTIKIIAPGSNPDDADRKGRGLTTASVYFDEFAFMKYNQITYEACLPAYKKAAENARKSNTPYGITITTTPNNLDIAEGAFCKMMIEKAAKWNTALFDFDKDKLNSYIGANSENNFIYVEYTYQELGRDEEWLKQMIRECNGNLAKIKREILLDWPKSMESSVFNEEELDRVYHFVKQPCSRIIIFDKYTVEFYEIPDLNRNYILSCDVAGGLSHDSSVINIIDPEDFRVVGDFVGNKIDTNDFMKLIRELMTLYMRNALLVIERNSYGLNILQTFMKDPKIEPRMYRENKNALGEKKTKDGFVVKKKTATIAYGVDTNTVTRKQMFDLLPEIVETEYDKFVSPNIYKNLVTLERKKTGKIEHSTSGHDDSLMAYLIFRWAVYYGKCFKDKFGINPVPSRMNVRVVSSNENLNKIEEIIKSANEKSDYNSMVTSPEYIALMDKERKISDSSKQLDSFMKIINFNND